MVAFADRYRGGELISSVTQGKGILTHQRVGDKCERTAKHIDRPVHTPLFKDSKSNDTTCFGELTITLDAMSDDGNHAESRPYMHEMKVQWKVENGDLSDMESANEAQVARLYLRTRYPGTMPSSRTTKL